MYHFGESNVIAQILRREEKQGQVTHLMIRTYSNIASFEDGKKRP